MNNNGGVSFDYKISSFTPTPFPLGQNFIFIAVFWTDVDTSYGHGHVHYREVTDKDLLDRITTDIVQVYRAKGFAFFTAQWAYIVTWYQVGAYGNGNYDVVIEISTIITISLRYNITSKDITGVIIRIQCNSKTKERYQNT